MTPLAVEALYTSPLTACRGVGAAVKAMKAEVGSFPFMDAAILIRDSRLNVLVVM
jgi:hypothetical protein